MKDFEFYRRALEHTAFRREKLEELLYFKHLGAALLIAASLGFFGHTLYAGLSHGRWDGGGGWLTLVALVAGVYGIICTRIAALRAIETISAPLRTDDRAH